MNLAKLFELQKELDARILAKHPPKEGEDRLAKKILALMVELGELCQEWRGFKFWSHEQEPRTWISTGICMYCAGTGNQNWDDDTAEDEDCDWCGGEGETTKNPLLEEYVDCLHFILSIGLDLRMDEVVDELDFKYASGKDTLGCFVDLYSDTTNLYYVRENDDMNSYFFESVVSKFIRLGEILCFTWEQIEESYFEKNRINHERQNNGY